VACDAPYLINLNETGLPVAYIPVVSSSISEMLAEATSVASKPTSGKLEATNDVVELAEKISRHRQQQIKMQPRKSEGWKWSRSR
jgi:hypothetical protein